MKELKKKLTEKLIKRVFNHSELIEEIITEFKESKEFKQLISSGAVKSFPIKELVSKKGVEIATSLNGWNAIHKLSDELEDTYYSGWMDCYKWIKKG
jgi:hypothetical protein